MNMRFAVIASFCLAAICGIARSSLSAQQTAPAAPAAASRTQWDGVYTEEQAQRGEPMYAKLCGSCHGADLAGTDKAPPVAGANFDANWIDQKMGDLSERMRTTMPVDSPGSLTRAQNADVLAYMLKKGGAPAGQTPLPTNVDQLNAIKYAKKS